MSPRPVDLPEWWVANKTPEDMAHECARYQGERDTLREEIDRLRAEVARVAFERDLAVDAWRGSRAKGKT